MIYCVEDDKNIRELVTYTLATTGMEAAGFEDGKTFWQEMKKQRPDLILLDIMLPEEDGMEILKKLKNTQGTQEIPVIMVTARSSEYDKVIGLDGGADDYITKPFGMMELVSRIKAVLRRTSPKGKKALAVRELAMDIGRHKVTVEDEEITLTLKEFELLEKLLENRNVVLTRDRLLEEIWGYDYIGETRTVDVHIRTLRQKLKSAGELIETVRGVGYRIGDQDEA